MRKADQKILVEYVYKIEKTLTAGHATEGSYYPVLKTLLESLGNDLTATSLPRRIECGAPDFAITKGSATIGYVEAKDLSTSLDEVERSEQMRRYLRWLPNLVLTNYLEFIWYVNGQRRISARIGTLGTDGKIKRNPHGLDEVGTLLTSFLAFTAPTPSTPKELAARLAHLAHLIREIIITAFEKKVEGDNLLSQFQAFQETLIPDLTPSQFADMYAQTIAYGLFAARCTQPAAGDFSRQNAAYLLPKTNPFLRKLFNDIAGPDLDDRIAWVVDDLASLLAQTEMSGILQNFGRHSAKEDPVVHFYETFLKEYDPKVREIRGVYYTPLPVVSYIVRSVDYLLRNRFQQSQGLADPTVLILDPAVGTGTFLFEVVQQIYQEMVKTQQMGLWDSYVREKLLSRLFGFELLMAPYAIAHLKIGLQLQDMGYQFQGDQRLGIYLTNTLEEAVKRSELLWGRYITEEADAAAQIKNEKPIMVVLGNPPYSGISANASVRRVTDPETGKEKQELTWIGKLIEDYKKVDGKPLGERKHWLQDDYVKFIRFGQWRIERTGQGILGFITNHAYLDNPTFRGMRQSLMNTFTEIYLLDLHGNVRKKEAAPDGSPDKNVFDIQQGVVIGIFVKEPGKHGPAKVYHADLWGTRKHKYQVLSERDIATTEWKELHPTSPFYFFIPRHEQLRQEYEQGWKVTDIFPVNSTGIVTARDSIVIDFSPLLLDQRLADFADTSVSDENIRQKYFSRKGGGKYPPGDTRGWNLPKARTLLRKEKNRAQHIKPCLYRPFDIRHIYYTAYMVDWPRFEVMRHMLAGENVALLTSRQMTKSGILPLTCTRLMVDAHCITDAVSITSTFPLYLYPIEGELELEKGRLPNLSSEFIKVISERLGLEFIPDGKGDLVRSLGPEDIFHYTYAVFHSPTYRSRYAEYLKIDFPRLPLTSDRSLFRSLAEKGAKLVSLHLLESPVVNNLITDYPVSGSNKVEKVVYHENQQMVYINKTQYFGGIDPEVWGFHIGGYQVCQKWLKDREGRSLSYDDLIHYQKVVVALKETLRLMEEIDALIPAWPLA